MRQAEAAITAPPDRFDGFLEVTLAALLVFAPLALGAVQAWSEFVVITLGAALGIGLALKHLVDPRATFVRSWAYLPLALFLGFTLLQLVPLPTAVLGVISPETLAAKSDLLADLRDPSDPLTITFFAHGTIHDLRLVLVLIAVFVAAIQVYRRPEALRRLLAIIATLGAGLALLAIAQNLTKAEEIYWLIPIQTKAANGGPFVNRNNFSLFMNLAIGASFALLLLKIRDGLEGVPKTLANVLDWVISPRAKWVWLLVGSILLGMVAIILSLSRGGTLSLLIAGIVTTLAMSWRQRLDGRGWIIVALVLGALACVLFLGSDAVFDRLATLEQHNAYQGRWQILEGVATAWTRFPITGTGLGTHQVVYPMFDRRTAPSLTTHAENEYAQLAEETGLVGILLVATFAGLLWWNWRRCVQKRDGGTKASVAFGMGFGLVAALVHSVSDFGLHIPANGALAATWCGVLVATAAIDRKSPVFSVRATRFIAATGLIVALGAGGWTLLTANEARLAERSWADAEDAESWLTERQWNAPDEYYVDLISNANAAVKLQPGNVDYRYRLGVYRWRAISRERDPETGDLILAEPHYEFIQRITDELHQARLACPTYGPLYCVAGQFERFLLGKEAGSRHIRRGYELAPHHPMVCLIAGLLDAIEDKDEAAANKLERALELEPSLRGPMFSALLERLEKPDLALAVAGNHADRLAALESRLSAANADPALALEVRQRTIARLLEDCAEPEAPAGILAKAAHLHQREKQHEKAAGFYERALTVDYGQVNWRLELAKTYDELGRIDEAIEQVQIILRLRPQMRAARTLIKNLRDRKTDRGTTPASQPSRTSENPPAVPPSGTGR